MVESLFLHTACVFEKNYRLQDIQLSKNSASALRASARQARDLLARHSPISFMACPPKRSLDATASSDAKTGGEYRARTGDLLVANQALSQLS